MNESQNPCLRSRFLRWLAGRASVGVVVAWLMTLAGFAGQWHWFLDAMNHTRWHLMWTCVLAVVVLCFAGSRRWTVVAILCLMVNLFVIRPSPSQFNPLHSAVSGGPAIKILFWNINAATTRTEVVLDVVEACEPDVVALIEVHPLHLAAFEPLRTGFQNHHEAPRSDSFGMAMYSKLPTEWIKTDGMPPEIRARLTWDGAELDVWSLHVLPPMGAAYLNERNRHFRRVAKDLAMADQVSRLTIVGGDFNITPWCKEFREFVSTSGLADSRDESGFHATWPSKLRGFGIPIDHVLVSPTLQVFDRRVLYREGVSDHAAVLLSIKVP